MKKGSKRVERPGLSSEEVDEIKQAFDLFDTNGTGKIDPKELKAAMQSLGFDSKNPTIYQLIADLDTPDAERNGGISFDDFVDAINDKLGDKESKEGIRRIFDLFIDDPNADTITLSSLKKISKELGENMSTGRESFEKLDSWHKLVKEALGDNIVLGVLGNKKDLFMQEQVKEEEAEEYAKSIGAIWALTSAKTERESFVTYVEDLIKEYIKKANIKNDKDDKTKDKDLIIREPSVKINNKETTKKKKKKIC